METSKKISFIAWVRFQQRSEFLAQHLGAAMHFIYHGQRGKRLQLPLRYLAQAWQSWYVLRRERPDVVFVQNPPIFCILIAFLYARMYKARYAIDSHTGAFYPPWGWFLWLHRILSRKAITTIVHNKCQEEIVKRWGCHTFILSDYPGPRPPGEEYNFEGQFNIAVVSSFAKDEPLDIVFQAARLLPETGFYVTGDHNRIGADLVTKKPDNCFLTGYLSYDRYLGLLRGANAIMALTTRDHTLLSGAWEAVSLGTPLITSDWPVLKEYFSLGTVHIPNTVEGVCWGVRKAQDGQKVLRHDMLRLREKLQSEWERKLSMLLDLLQK